MFIKIACCRLKTTDSCMTTINGPSSCSDSSSLRCSFTLYELTPGFGLVFCSDLHKEASAPSAKTLSKTRSRVSLGLLLQFSAILPLFSFKCSEPKQTVRNPKKMHFIATHPCLNSFYSKIHDRWSSVLFFIPP